MKYIVTKKDKNITGTINLPLSKNINNRLLLIKAIRNFGTENTIDLTNKKPGVQNTLKSEKFKFNVAMRFLADFIKRRKGEWLIADAKKKKNKYVERLVKALKEAGANINYIVDTGYPPIKITGKQLKDDIIKIDASASKQFISVSLLISPVYSQNITLRIKDKLISASYIKTALKLMKYLGIPSIWHKGEILYENEYYENMQITLEADWSIASYFYEMVALSKRAELIIHGLNEDSVQPEAIVPELFEKFGVRTTFFPNGVKLSKQKVNIKYFEHDFSSTPDLIPAFIVTSAMIKIPFKISGHENLIKKQPDCMVNLKKELEKLGVKVVINQGSIVWDGKLLKKKNNYIKYMSFHNQRIAMALAPLAIILDEVEINNPKMVNAIYSRYWSDLSNITFTVKEMIEK